MVRLPLFYIAARLARRALPTTLPVWLRKALPFLDGNLGAADGGAIVRLYEKRMGDKKPADWPRGLTVLEVGTGATNGSCYELAARGAARAISLEPFVALNAVADAAQLSAAAKDGPQENVAARVDRLLSSSGLASGSVDCILSNSVLEHVTAPAELFAELARLLKPGGFMLHIVDYRDHFFRYPYHFLMWSRAAWDRWLNPGDLPRNRISDHVSGLEKAGLRVEVLLARTTDGWAALKPHVHPEFSHYTEDALSTAFGVLWAEHRKD
jgi:SAM-dependent methyltransferase